MSLSLYFLIEIALLLMPGPKYSFPNSVRCNPNLACPRAPEVSTVAVFSASSAVGVADFCSVDDADFDLIEVDEGMAILDKGLRLLKFARNLY